MRGTELSINRISLSKYFEHLPSADNGISYLKHTGRFGMNTEDTHRLSGAIDRAAAQLAKLRSGKKLLCMGTGEFMYIPMRLAAKLGDNVSFQSTTRSPIWPHPDAQYAVNTAYRFASPEQAEVTHYMYNIPPGRYDELFFFMEREVPESRMEQLRHVLGSLHIPMIHIVYFSPIKTIAAPAPMGSYKREDVVFLLKDLSGISLERSSEAREEAMQLSAHYSESLPIEYEPTPEYMALFHDTLHGSAERTAQAAGTVAEIIVNKKGMNVVLASLARAGTPVGVLIKRYIKQVYDIDLPHYSISIIRGKGVDENALLYMIQNHPGMPIQFVDGWTGKGAIRNVLIEACQLMKAQYGIVLDDDLAVLADPGRCAGMFGTREDYLIPSACLNSTVSGLISRTVLRNDLIGPGDFHGAKFYREWLDADVSNLFVDTVSSYFTNIQSLSKAEAAIFADHPELSSATWQGLQDIQRIQHDFGITDVNLIKPGIGETTRVLLRRVPWKILVDRLDNPELKHIRLLAQERNVPIEQYPGLIYSCCGLIKPVKGDAQ
jgi:hypothetical protein